MSLHASRLMSRLIHIYEGVTVSVFPSTLRLTALLLKSFRLRLHCYTLIYVTEHRWCIKCFLSSMWRDIFICVTWHIHKWDMTWPPHDPRLMLWLIHMCDITQVVDETLLFIYVTWLIHMYDMTHLFVWHTIGSRWNASLHRRAISSRCLSQ